MIILSHPPASIHKKRDNMDLKDKLNLLWKYLFLAVLLVFGILLLTRHPGYYRGDHHYGYKGAFRGDLSQGKMPGGGMVDASEVRVEKKVINNDTTVVVWVNGEKIDNPEEFLKERERDLTSGVRSEIEVEDERGMKIKKIHINIREDEDDDDDDDDD